MMRSHLAVFVVLFSVALFGCQAASIVPVKDASAATCAQDVVDAWNLHCAANNFDAISIGTSATAGETYIGSDFGKDADNFMRDIQIEVNSSCRPNLIDDEMVSAIINNSFWY